MRKTKILWSNCFFAIWYLFFRGKVKKIVAIESKSVFWPHHYVCINKDGNAIHFQYVDHPENHKFAPWWFQGQFVGIKKSEIEEELIKSGRKVKLVFEEEKLIFAILVLSSIFSFLFIPWIIAWGLYVPVWATFWSIHALKFNKFIKRHI